MNTWPALLPPTAEKKIHNRIIHNDHVVDPYYWMNDYFKKGPDSDRAIQYLEAQNRYLEEMMSDTTTFQEQLFNEMKARIREEDESVPVLKNGYYYYTRTDIGCQYFKYCRKKGDLDAPEELVLDVDQLAEGHSYYSVTGFNISDDNSLMIFGVDTVSRRQHELYVKNLFTGEISNTGISNTTGVCSWANDNKTFFYTANNSTTLLTEQIKRRTLQSDPSSDVTVYFEHDTSNYIGVHKSKSREFIFIYSGGTLSSEIRFIRADEPHADFVVFQQRGAGVLYHVTALSDRFLVRTNWDAVNFRLMECDFNHTHKDDWREIIPHRSDVLLAGVDEFRSFLVLTERSGGLLQLRIQDLETRTSTHLDFGEPAYTAATGSNPEYDTLKFRYTYTSLTTPPSVYDYDLASGDKLLLKQQQVEGGYDRSEYTTERHHVTARDGALVPVSIVYKNGFEKNGSSPLLLYAYGSYGHSIDATFSSARLSLLNRGFAFAIAHIRGGQEMGREWYEQGKMMNKMNTFTDFIDCAEHLVKVGFTSPQHLYAQGGSAGGLLMGVIINLAPALWNGVIAQVPFVDVVNTMLDDTIPLTTNEYDEWGNPNNPEHYFYMKGYSPYENIKAENFPNLLVTTGLHDSQVQYFEPAKWVAKLQELNTGKNVILMHTNMKFGHGGASGRFDYLKDVALNFAFLLKLENKVDV